MAVRARRSRRHRPMTLRSRCRRAAALIGAALGNRSGSSVIYSALLAPILVGFAALSADVGLWYLAKRTAQSAADAAAMAAGFEVARGSGAGAIRAAAEGDAALNGYNPDAGDALTVNRPPAAGPTAGDSTAVEVILRRTPPLFFSRLMLDGPVTVTARAVAQAAGPESCVWVLEPDDTGLELVGSADVVLGCGVYANSTSPAAIDQRGASCLTASSVSVAGGTSGACIHPTPRRDASQLGDPIAYLEAPTTVGCSHRNKRINTPEVLSPGVYCGGIEITGNAVVVFQPGTYVIAGGTLKATGNSILTGSGVTFYLTSGTGGHADLRLNATVVDLSAPTSGPLKGVLFFQDRDAPESIVNDIAGNADLRLQGVLYFPTTELKFAGGSALTGTSTVVVARKIRFVGNSSLRADPSLTLYPSGLVSAAMLE